MVKIHITYSIIGTKIVKITSETGVEESSTVEEITLGQLIYDLVDKANKEINDTDGVIKQILEGVGKK